MNHMPGTRFELVTRGFSVLCSTNWAIPTIPYASSTHFTRKLGSMSIKRRKGITKSYLGPGISCIFKRRLFFVSLSTSNDMYWESFKWVRVLLAQSCSRLIYIIHHKTCGKRKTFLLGYLCERRVNEEDTQLLFESLTKKEDN